MRRLVMLTAGDALDTTRSVARKVGIRESSVYARVLPEDKSEIIRNLQHIGEKVAMGVAGTDVAMETADIALMADDLSKIPESLHISRLTLRNIYQNVAMAMFAVVVLLTGVFMGEVHMAGGMLIHELSVMTVIGNGLRLKWR